MSMTEPVIDDGYIQLCLEEMYAAAEASQRLIRERFNEPFTEDWTQAQIDRRRAELYKEHFDAAGIAIVRVGPPNDELLERIKADRHE